MPAPRRAPANYLMADISANNGTGAFNAGHYSAAGHLAIAVKATEGTGYVNPLHASWSDGAHEHRLGVVHYHFAHPELGNPAGQAQHFWATVRPHYRKAVDRLVVDIEVGPLADWPGWLRAFDDELHRYSTINAAGYTFASAPLEELELRSREWWLASWGAKQPSGAFRRLPGHQSLWAWQMYGGTVNPSGGPEGAAGIAGRCDMSVINPAYVRALKAALKR